MKLIITLSSTLLIFLSAARISGAVFEWQHISPGPHWESYDGSSGSLTYNNGIITDYYFEVHQGPWYKDQSVVLTDYVASILPNGDLSLRTYGLGHDNW